MIDVLVCDDSMTMRSLMQHIIGSQTDMRCVAAARNAYEARELIKKHDPHVLTLDVEMPMMTGVEFLEKIMRLRPMPVLMVSKLTQRGSEIAIRALELGAVDVLAKPGSPDELEVFAQDLVTKVRTAARSRVRRARAARPNPEVEAPLAEDVQPVRSAVLIAIGASTGGCQAVTEIVTGLRGDLPAVVVAQHMPPNFTKLYAERLDRIARIRVREVVDGEPLMRGHMYIAPGDQHLTIERDDGGFIARVHQGPKRHNVRPSVDELFEGVASMAGRRAVGVILTGMGADGASGLLRMRRAGGITLAQDEASSTVFGMPAAAIDLGAVQDVVGLDHMAVSVMRHAARMDMISGEALH